MANKNSQTGENIQGLGKTVERPYRPREPIAPEEARTANASARSALLSEKPFTVPEPAEMMLKERQKNRSEELFTELMALLEKPDVKDMHFIDKVDALFYNAIGEDDKRFSVQYEKEGGGKTESRMIAKKNIPLQERKRRELLADYLKNLSYSLDDFQQGFAKVTDPIKQAKLIEGFNARNLKALEGVKNDKGVFVGGLKNELKALEAKREGFEEEMVAKGLLVPTTGTEGIVLRPVEGKEGELRDIVMEKATDRQIQEVFGSREEELKRLMGGKEVHQLSDRERKIFDHLWDQKREEIMGTIKTDILRRVEQERPTDKEGKPKPFFNQAWAGMFKGKGQSGISLYKDGRNFTDKRKYALKELLEDQGFIKSLLFTKDKEGRFVANTQGREVFKELSGIVRQNFGEKGKDYNRGDWQIERSIRAVCSGLVTGEGKSETDNRTPEKEHRGSEDSTVDRNATEYFLLAEPLFREMGVPYPVFERTGSDKYNKDLLERMKNMDLQKLFYGDVDEATLEAFAKEYVDFAGRETRHYEGRDRGYREPTPEEIVKDGRIALRSLLREFLAPLSSYGLYMADAARVAKIETGLDATTRMNGLKKALRLMKIDLPEFDEMCEDIQASVQRVVEKKPGFARRDPKMSGQAQEELDLLKRAGSEVYEKEYHEAAKHEGALQELSAATGISVEKLIEQLKASVSKKPSESEAA